jgi:hypothetical protein
MLYYSIIIIFLKKNPKKIGSRLRRRELQVCLYTCACVCVCMCVFVCVFVHVCMYILTYAYIYSVTYTHIYGVDIYMAFPVLRIHQYTLKLN